MRKTFKMWSFMICSTGKNENGRTPCMTYLIKGDQITKLPGELLDSPADYESIRNINKHMEEFRRQNIIKQIQSERSAAKVIINC